MISTSLYHNSYSMICSFLGLVRSRTLARNKLESSRFFKELGRASFQTPSQYHFVDTALQ